MRLPKTCLPMPVECCCRVTCCCSVPPPARRVAPPARYTEKKKKKQTCWPCWHKNQQYGCCCMCDEPASVSVGPAAVCCLFQKSKIRQETPAQHGGAMRQSRQAGKSNEDFSRFLTESHREEFSRNVIGSPIFADSRGGGHSPVPLPARHRVFVIVFFCWWVGSGWGGHHKKASSPNVPSISAHNTPYFHPLAPRKWRSPSLPPPSRPPRPRPRRLSAPAVSSAPATSAPTAPCGTASPPTPRLLS